ncbi:MAG TPA: hypothetical protein VHZ25_19335 [Acidobacteriaceae bacterium]|jgi:Flp pilus assembly protein protease CpaA|nr:hypothetical protein [Acidobacteriaceae bacterium]
MNPQSPNPPLTDADLDRALTADHDSILPSSGFAGSVMNAVSAEAAAPAPLTFPWKRALPGVAVGCVVLGVVLVSIILGFLRRLHTPVVASSVNARALFAPMEHYVNGGAVWFAVCLAISGACLLFCRRLVSSD